MGGKSSKPIKNAFYEENISIINNLRKVEYFTNYKNWLIIIKLIKAKS